MRIIVNADDLGMNEAVNDAVFGVIQRGFITSATILANGPAVESAARGARHFPDCSFGVHLNLTEFEPICPESQRDLKSIVGEDKCFQGNSIREVHISLSMLRAIFREWCQQIERLRRLGIEPTHIDTHHHVHTLPQMLPVLAALRKRYKIHKIRISRNLYEQSEYPGQILLLKKRAYNLALRSLGFRTTGIFADLRTFTKVCQVPPAAKSAELMTHPGSLLEDEEAGLLDSNWIGRLPYKVALISYRDL